MTRFPEQDLFLRADGAIAGVIERLTAEQLAVPAPDGWTGRFEHPTVGQIVLVHAHALEAGDRRIRKLGRRDRLIGDLAERDDRIFVAIAIDGELRAARDLPGAMRGQQHEIKAVLNLVDAILDRNARHGGSVLAKQECRIISTR